MTTINNLAGCYSMKRYIDQAVKANDTPKTRDDAFLLMRDIDRILYNMSDLGQHKRAWLKAAPPVLDDVRLLAIVAGRVK